MDEKRINVGKTFGGLWRKKKLLEFERENLAKEQ